MPLTITEQFNMIFFSLITGIVIGMLFDVYRIGRGVCKFKIIVIIQDILFWIFAAIVIFTFLLYTNYAFLSAYVYSAIIFSTFFYVVFISNEFYNVEKKMVELSCYNIVRRSNHEYRYNCIIGYFGRFTCCRHCTLFLG